MNLEFVLVYCAVAFCKDALCIIIYIRLFSEAINLCIEYCLAKVPRCEQYYKDIVWSLFQNGSQRAEIAISLIFVM